MKVIIALFAILAVANAALPAFFGITAYTSNTCSTQYVGGSGGAVVAACEPSGTGVYSGYRCNDNSSLVEVTNSADPTCATGGVNTILAACGPVPEQPGVYIGSKCYDTYSAIPRPSTGSFYQTNTYIGNNCTQVTPAAFLFAITGTCIPNVQGSTGQYLFTTCNSTVTITKVYTAATCTGAAVSSVTIPAACAVGSPVAGASTQTVCLSGSSTTSKATSGSGTGSGSSGTSSTTSSATAITFSAVALFVAVLVAAF